jgi:hypothetical protein
MSNRPLRVDSKTHYGWQHVVITHLPTGHSAWAIAPTIIEGHAQAWRQLFLLLAPLGVIQGVNQLPADVTDELIAEGAQLLSQGLLPGCLANAS